jgi:type VI secretion system protein ImpG
MPDDLLTYYERELAFLRQIGAEFAGKYPEIATACCSKPTSLRIPC